MSSPSASSPSSRDLKRAKYEAKQASQRMAKEVEQTRTLWLNGREDYAAFITVQDVRDIKRLLGRNEDSVSSSSCSNDARSKRLMQISNWIAPFFDLKELPTSKVTNERLFVSEGTEAVRMMIQRCVGGTINNSSITCNPSSGGSDVIIPPSVRLFSILTKPATFFDPPTHLLQDIEERSLLGVNGSSDTLPPFKIVIADEKAMTEIAGFPIARGAMACGVIPNYIQTNAYSWLKGILSNSTTSQPRRLLALDAVSNAANMGSIIRTAAAFSIDAIILSDDSCDAFYRQSVRTSMGHVISLPILRVSDWEKRRNEDDVDDNDDECTGLAKILRWLRKTMNVECLAAVVDDDSVLLEDQTETSRSWCCVLGNEGNGIRDTVIQECDVRVKIGMASGVDSLSLPIAAGILLHSLSSRSKKGQ
jgi:tRNA G18 (ribose-2'-O)-methylase SpoU